MVKTHGQQDQLKQEMKRPLLRALELLGLIQYDLETRQTELQMEGADLSAVENELFNVVRDCKIGFLQLQGFLFHFLLSGKKELIAACKQLTGNLPKNSIPTLAQTSVSLQKTQFIQHAKEIKELARQTAYLPL